MCQIRINYVFTDENTKSLGFFFKENYKIMGAKESNISISLIKD